MRGEILQGIVCPLCSVCLACHPKSVCADNHRKFHDDFEFKFIDAVDGISIDIKNPS